MSVLYAVAGSGQSFTFSVNPSATSTPTVGVYSDTGRTALVTTATVTGSGAAWSFVVPTSLTAATYYLKITAPTAGGTATDVSDSLIVTSSAIVVSASALPLDEVKAHLDIKGSANDVEVQRFINAAETAIAHRTGPLQPVLVTERHDGGQRSIVLRKPRASSLTSVTYQTGQTTNVTDLDLDPDTGIIYWNFGTLGCFYGGTRNVIVTYTAGFATLPEDLRFGVKELVRYLWETQRPNASGAKGGGYGSDPDSPITVPDYGQWPRRVQQAIEPYSVPNIA